jgi:hypothetical protein
MKSVDSVLDPLQPNLLGSRNLQSWDPFQRLPEPCFFEVNSAGLRSLEGKFELKHGSFDFGHCARTSSAPKITFAHKLLRVVHTPLPPLDFLVQQTMDVKNLVERLGGEEAVRKMAAFQLQNQILVLP